MLEYFVFIEFVIVFKTQKIPEKKLNNNLNSKEYAITKGTFKIIIKKDIKNI